MEQNTPTNALPTGYSANDIVSNDNTNTGGNLPPGYSQDDIVSGKSASPMTMNDSDSVLTKAGKAVGGGLEGIGEGMFGTLAGGADIVNKVTGQQAGGITNELHNLAGDNEQQSGSEKVGQGLETIGEFLMGDAALKGLSLADKMTQVSKVMKFIEKSPKLAQALRLGINVGKAGTELGPEERAALQKYPVLARLAGAGLDAVRAGTVQAGQTELKSGGDTGQALRSGAGMAAGSGLVGGALGTAGGLLAKGGQAADTVSALRNAAEAAPTGTEANAKLASTVEGGLQPQIEEAQNTLNEANDKIAGASSVAESAANNAPTNQTITAQAQTAAKAGQKALNDAYHAASEKVRNDLEDTTVDYGGSKLHQIAQEIEAGGKEAKVKNPLLEPLKITKPGSQKVNDMVTRFADPEGTFSLDDEGLPKQITADNLLDAAKDIKERLRNTGWSTAEERADRDVYFKLLDGVHGTLEDLATESGKPDALKAVQAMNADYKAGISKFNNPDVKGILQGGAEPRILNLLSGGKSVGDIQAIKGAIGDKSFSTLADSAVQRMAADSVDTVTGKFNFDKFFKNWNRIPTDVRGEMFQGSLKGGALENALNQVKAVNASGAAEEAEGNIKNATDTMKNLLGNGDVSTLLKDPERINELSKVVGPQAMGELGNTVLQNQLREAATDVNGKVGNVDTGKVLKFIESLKDSPEVVNGLFKPTPETAKAYNKLIGDLQGVQSVKNAIKAGIIAPALVGGGIAGHAMGSAILGALAVGGGEVAAKGIIEKIANSPQAWGSLRWLNNAAQTPTAAGTKMLARYAAGRGAGAIANSLKNVYNTTKSQLSQ